LPFYKTRSQRREVLNTQDRIAAQQAQEVRDHQLRLSLRAWKDQLGLPVVVALCSLVLYVSFFSIHHVDVAARRLIFLVPVFAIGGLMLVSREWIDQNVGRHLTGPSMDVVKKINDSSMAVPAIVLLVCAGLYVLGLGFLVKLVTFFALIAFAAFRLPPVTDWLAQEPDLSHFKATGPVGKPDPKSFSSETESAEFTDVGSAGQDHKDDGSRIEEEDIPPANKSKDLSPDAVVLKNPDLTEAEQRLAQARADVAAFEGLSVPKGAEERRDHNRTLGRKKAKVTRLTKKVLELGGDPESLMHHSV